MIHLENVDKIYPRPEGTVDALRDVTLDVRPGEFVAVRGPSGCGKSTLLTIIGGLGMPTAGRVIVGGKDLGAMSSAERAHFRARQVGFVFQMFHLLPYLSVLENVAVAEVSRDRAAAQRLLERFGLAGRLRHHPAELSIGQRQRVAIARALVNRPPLVLADEPTGNLDPESSAEVLRLLVDYHREGGTVLLVTHEEQAARCAERTVLLKDGTIQQGEAVGSSEFSQDTPRPLLEKRGKLSYL
jgi:putative ABC transport system ATP-binding protein